MSRIYKMHNCPARLSVWSEGWGFRWKPGVDGRAAASESVLEALMSCERSIRRGIP